MGGRSGEITTSTLLVLCGLLLSCGGSGLSPSMDMATVPSAEDVMKFDLERIFEGAVAYFDATHMDGFGQILHRQFPATVGLTPSTACCDSPGDVCDPGLGFLDDAVWPILGFVPSPPQRYQFEYRSFGVDDSATFDARAVGDPGCTGHPETWHLTGKARGAHGVIDQGPSKVSE